MKEIADIEKSYHCPSRIIWSSSQTENPQVLLTSRSGQPTTKPRPVCRLNPGGSLLLDFGEELFGGLQFITGNTHKKNTHKLRIRLGESVSEAMGQANNDHGINDETITLPWIGLTEFGKTGFRFARIDLLDSDGFVELCELRAYSYLRPLTYKGSFECSDKLLNKIWKTGAKTVHLNIQDYIWDGIKRDRLVWVGDMHPEICVIASVFGEIPDVAKSLDFVRNETPLPEFMNGISSYSMWWLIIHHQWYLYTGNFDYLSQQRDYIIALLDHLAKYIDTHGKENLPEMRFIDWQTANDDNGMHIGLQSLFAMTIKISAELMGFLNEASQQQRCGELYAKMSAYRNTATSNSKSANAIKTIAGLDDAQQINRDILSSEPFNGLSTFFGYYVLQARAAAGDFNGCLKLIRKYWGGMLQLGATTFWEHFNINWLNNAGRIDELPTENKIDIHATYGAHCFKGYRHSLCHGWAAGPTAWLSEHVLGISPTSPGFQTLNIAPHLGDLEWARGTMPTPHGLIEVEHKKKSSGSIETTYSLPDKITFDSFETLKLK